MDTRKRPHDDEGAADYQRRRNRTEGATVERVTPVVAHHEHVAGRHDDGSEVCGPVAVRCDIRLRQRPVIDIDDAVRRIDHLTGQTDHPFDEVGIGGWRRGWAAEYNDVTAMHCMQPI